jgi:alkyl-hydroperoxide reductase/thiol specific antioxidant family protein
MGNTEQGAAMFARYGLADVPHFSDPDCRLYRAFGLERASLRRFLTWAIVKRGAEAFRRGHFVGQIVGDGLRMPGVFLLHRGQVLRSYRHENPYDRPDYEALAACPLPGAEA